MNYIKDFQYNNNNNFMTDKKKTKFVLIKNINQDNINYKTNDKFPSKEEYKITPIKSRLNKDKETKDSDCRGKYILGSG